MNCPACKEPMIILEYQDVEVDFCTACAGVWLDAGELELLFGEREIADGFLSAGVPAEAQTEALRKCPICRKAMGKHATKSDAPVVYDHCPHGHGLWFDHGELAAVLEQGSEAAGGEDVVAWLRELFPANAPDA